MKNLIILTAAGFLTLIGQPLTENNKSATTEVVVQSEPFIGEISLFAGNFAPRGWAFCDGQLLPINQNQALFSLLGTTYGGDGRTTFALPDLRGRVPIHAGTGPGLSTYKPGQKGGAESADLNGNSGSIQKTKPSMGQQINNVQPYLTVNYIIALQGVYPSRN